MRTRILPPKPGQSTVAQSTGEPSSSARPTRIPFAPRPLRRHCGEGSDLAQKTLALVLAGGKGSRLSPLTRHVCKPAVPFGGGFRLIDFTLSNCINSGLRRIGVMTQYQQHSMLDHLQGGWNFLCPALNEFVEALPSQQCEGNSWYTGTANALYQNLGFIKQLGLPYTLVLAGDHIYKADYARMLDFHSQSGADVTVGCVDVSREAASQFGIVGTDPCGQILSFTEKPRKPATVPGRSDTSFASMGIYIFDTEVLIDMLNKDAQNSLSSHDFGHDIIPSIIDSCRVMAYPYNQAQPCDYWRDVGTLDAYFEANMDLLTPDSPMNIYDKDWPVIMRPTCQPPSRFSCDHDHRLGIASDSIIASGCIVEGASISHSILFAGVSIREHSSIRTTLLLPGVQVGRNCSIRNAIIDADTRIPDGTIIGFEGSRDSRNYLITPKGIVTVTADDLPTLAKGDRQGVTASSSEPDLQGSHDYKRGYLA